MSTTNNALELVKYVNRNYVYYYNVETFNFLAEKIQKAESHYTRLLYSDFAFNKDDKSLIKYRQLLDDKFYDMIVQKIPNNSVIILETYENILDIFVKFKLY